MDFEQKVACKYQYEINLTSKYNKEDFFLVTYVNILLYVKNLEYPCKRIGIIRFMLGISIFPFQPNLNTIKYKKLTLLH